MNKRPLAHLVSRSGYRYVSGEKNLAPGITLVILLL